MIYAKYTSLKLWGLLLVVSTLLASPVLAQADEMVKSGTMPSLFDANERLPKPDLSVLLRLRFLITTDFPPFGFLDQTGHLTGYNMDLIREVCKELGVEAKCEVQAVPFSDIQIGLLSKHADAAVAGMAVTRAIRADFAFSRPYLMLPARFVVRKHVVPAPKTAADLDGTAVGVVTGTAHEAMLKAFFPGIKPMGFADQAALMQALQQGAVQTVFTDGLQASFWLASQSTGKATGKAENQPGEPCCEFLDGPFLSQHFLGEGMTIMVRKEDGFLAAAFDYALAALSRKGRLDELSRRYFVSDLY
ncbi:transporter substrate-binding domain-containing protein [Rhizobium sp.]|uniref:transporter substrate-binding domain-containing protein n=1 Tax=Rhizobium sp. TaxID=391 RepID=UPI000E980A52|nr:amino acid ABC transporter [Rhizobium sp.]